MSRKNIWVIEEEEGARYVYANVFALQYQLRLFTSVEELREAIADDKSAGHLPFCVVPTIGTTSSSSVDDVDRIADIGERINLWLHVVAAYAGPTATVPDFQHFFKV